ncbi:MAG: chemotaxis response regulator protein-glutamate methylesterase [Pseudomonadales bacterium]|nr:chemotaxis response regulator protein-glutamate methylesterase [Pseudomonadales bacterium]
MKKVTVLVVDDSPLMRHLITQMLEATPEIEVIGDAEDAKVARDKIKALNPDVITLDIEMPGMDGLSFLEKLMQLRPTPVVMVSSLTTKNARHTVRALEIGAVEVVCKPNVESSTALEDYAVMLGEKVITASKAKFTHIETIRPTVAAKPVIDHEISKSTKKLIAIGSSTGGTVAVESVLVKMPSNCPPIVITQHIPPGFSKAFADRVNEIAAINVREAQDGDELKAGTALVAPGDRHLLIHEKDGRYFCTLKDSEPVSRHKPSVDVLFDSVAKSSNGKALGIILTGMGSDGASGMKHLHDSGNQTLAQDEASSMVWGMPKKAIDAGGVDRVVGITDVPSEILTYARSKR